MQSLRLPFAFSRAFYATLNTAGIKNIIVTGKSGAGKQPRIDVLLKKFQLPQLSTGNIFREYIGKFKKSGFTGTTESFWDEAKNGFIPDDQIVAKLKAAGAKGDLADAALGLKATHFVLAGKFVPDSVTNELFAAFYSKMNYSAVLDGYPRTVEQGNYLFDLLKKKNSRIDFYLLVDNTDERIIQRTVGRRICGNPACGKVYHITDKPPKDGKFCKACGTEVIHRIDDTEPKIRSRLDEFHTKVEPALELLKANKVPGAVVTGHLEVFTDELVEKSVLEALQAIPKLWK